MYVYFIQMQAGSHYFCKIGRSKDPQNRLGELQVGNPFNLVLIGTVRCQSDRHSMHVERLAHRMFRSAKRRGEWFYSSPKMNRAIHRVIDMAREHQEDTERGESINADLDQEFFAITRSG